MYSKILYPINISEPESWGKSLEVALDYTKRYGAELYVITVVPDFRMSIVSDHFPAGSGEQMVEKTWHALQEFADNHMQAASGHVHLIVAQGKIADNIVEQSRKIEADLIIMTAHEKELRDYFIGTNSNRVTAHASCSVLVIR